MDGLSDRHIHAEAESEAWDDAHRDTPEMAWPDGYCLDPNGKMSIPAGKEEDFNFGYEIGFNEAWEIMNTAIAAHNLRREM